MEIEKLVLDETALDKLGLGDKAVYLVEYDLNSERKIRKDLNAEQRKALQKRNQLARGFRNDLIYILKYHLRATRHLESCWIIEEKRLETAIKGLEELKAKMKGKGFTDVDKRLRIIPILTTEEGIQNYEDKKAEFLLELAMEHIRYLEKVERERRAGNGVIWKCKKAFEVVSELKDELKANKRFKELVDTVEILDELICRCDKILKVEKNKKQ